MHDPGPFRDREAFPPPPSMPQPLPPQSRSDALLPRDSISTIPLPVSTPLGAPSLNLHSLSPPPFESGASSPGPVAQAPTSPDLAAQFPGTPPPMNPEAPLLSAPELTAPVEEPSLFTHKRNQSSFSKTGAEALKKSPLMWKFRTALIGMFCTIPVFLFPLFIGNISVLRFSFPLMFIGLFTGLAFRKFSRPWPNCRTKSGPRGQSNSPN